MVLIIISAWALTLSVLLRRAVQEPQSVEWTTTIPRLFCVKEHGRIMTQKRKIMESKKLMLALASFILVTSCSNKDSEIMPQIGETVDFTASMKTVSRATETTFEEGDKIGVYAVNAQANTASILQPSGNYADNVRYPYNNGKFINAQGIVRPTDSGLRYYAIYPYTTPCGPTFKFNVKTNQNASGQYTLSDLCTAVSDITLNKEVDLVFSHRLSHVVVNLKGELLGTGTATVRLNNVNTGCDADLNANTFTAYESRNTVYCADNGTNSYKAIIAPQTIEDGSAFLTVSLNGKEHTLKASSDIRLTSGKQQVFNLTIEKDEIVSFIGEILPWGENTDSKQEAKVNIYIGGMYDGLWDGYVPCVWLNGEMHTLGVNNYDEGSVYGCAYSMTVSNNDVYVVGHQTPPLSSEAGIYYENATIWKNGAILSEGINRGLATTSDILVYNDKVLTVGLSESGAPYLIKDKDVIWLPKRSGHKNNWTETIDESNGDIYILGRNVTESSNYFGTNRTFFWKNQELMDYDIEGDGLCLSVQDGHIYCLVKKADGMLYLWKDGQITATGLKDSGPGVLGPTFKPMFVDGEDVYIVGHQNEVAKIWKNGEISLLTTEDNHYSLTGIYVYHKDVYVIGYEVVSNFDAPAPPYQHSIIKLWKNGEENTLDDGGWISYPCSIIVTSNND